MKLIKVHELSSYNGKVTSKPCYINPDQIIFVYPDDGVRSSGEILGSQAYICLMGHHSYIAESPEEIVRLINETSQK